MHAQSYFREWFELIVKLMDKIDGYKFYQNFCCRKSWYMNHRKKTDGLYEKNPISWRRKTAIMACYLVNRKILDLESMKPLPSLIIFLAVILPGFYFDESINPLNVKSMQQETKIAPFRNLRLLKKGIFSVLYVIFKEIVLECRYTVSIATEFWF